MPQPVNRPMDNKLKEQDIERKLQLFGIYEGFKNGKLPSNKQCDIAMNSALASKALSSPSKELSEDGQVLVKDLRNVIEQAKKLMLSKNEGQLIQEFIWGATHFSTGDAQKPSLPTDKESSKQDAGNAAEDLKTLGTLLITNGEFRKLLNDIGIIARDMAGDASQQAANKVRPSEEQLSQVDQPAEENTWLEKPDTEAFKSRVKPSTKKNKGATEEGSPDVSSTAKEESEGGKKPKKGAKASAEKTKEDAQAKAPEETKSRTSEMSGKAKNYLNEKLPQERRDQGIARLKKMVVELQGHPDYQRAIETLLALVEKYGGMSKNVSGQGAGAAKDLRGSDSVKSMERSLRTLLERFANSTSLDDVFGALDNLYHDADEDPELRGWFKDMNTFIRQVLQEKGWATTDDCTRDWNGLYERGNYLLRHRYKNHSQRILDEIKFFGDQFNQDSQNKAFADSMQKLFIDLGRTDGKVAFKKHLVKDLRDVILPAFLSDVRYIPVPRLEVADKMVDVVVENIVIESDNLMPNVMEFGSDNYFRWGRKKITNKRDNKIMISVSGIQADIRDISYYVKKKEGFPSITDKGIMDIFLGGEGFGFKIAASTAQKEDRQHFFKVDKVTVNIHDMDIKLKKSKHRVLFSVFKPMLFNVVRPALEKVLTKQIHDSFAKGDEFAYDVHLEAKKAEEAAKGDPENQRGQYKRYMDAVRARMEASKAEKAKQPKSDTKVQTPFTLHDSLFPDITLPGAVSTKATGYADLAKKGERWESPVFSIGKAAESTDLPKPASITRKRHQTAESKRIEPEKADRKAGKKTKGDGANADYSTRGFADEVSSAISDGDPKNAPTNGAKVQPQTAFNPQAA